MGEQNSSALLHRFELWPCQRQPDKVAFACCREIKNMNHLLIPPGRHYNTIAQSGSPGSPGSRRTPKYLLSQPPPSACLSSPPQRTTHRLSPLPLASRSSSQNRLLPLGCVVKILGGAPVCWG